MKKAYTLTTALVLTLCLLAGCGCRNSKPGATTAPTTMPTQTSAPSEETTMPTTMATESSSAPTIQDGNGPISTDGTTDGNNGQAGDPQSRSGGMIGGAGNGGMNSGAGNGISGNITG